MTEDQKLRLEALRLAVAMNAHTAQTKHAYELESDANKFIRYIQKGTM